MPKFNTAKRFFDSLVGKALPLEELERLLAYAKAELDDYDDATDEIKLELNDTNRPDLWSAAGLARQLRSVIGAPRREYDFFSSASATRESGERVIRVEENVREVRPFIVGFEALGPPLSDAILKELIHTQERLAWNYGRKRRSIAMGIYPVRAIEYPLRYRACDPDATAFAPLGMERALSLREILARHPKGREFGALIRDHPAYPCIIDRRGTILSMPPIINSREAGEVAVGDTHLFVELTGDTLEHLHTANNIIACDLCDLGFTIRPIMIRYERDGAGNADGVPAVDADGKGNVDAAPGAPAVCTAPYNFHCVRGARIANIRKLLGVEMSPAEIRDSIARLGMACRIVGEGEEGGIEVTPLPWRNDYLHEVDIIEDVMIGVGLHTFTPLPVSDFTIGALLPIERLSRRVVRVMVGLGFQEMIYNYLVADEDFIRKMYPRERWAEEEARAIGVANPRSDTHNMVRGSVLPSLLGSCAVSAQALLPHKIFEIGKTVARDDDANYGSTTRHTIGIVHSATDAHFTSINEQVSAIMYYLNIEYNIDEADDPRFISGRCAAIRHNGATVGIMGEVHPRVLENWRIHVPTAACEMHISLFDEA